MGSTALFVGDLKSEVNTEFTILMPSTDWDSQAAPLLTLDVFVKRPEWVVRPSSS